MVIMMNYHHDHQRKDVCNWEDCEKMFRTKLALKARVISTHIGKDIFKKG